MFTRVTSEATLRPENRSTAPEMYATYWSAAHRAKRQPLLDRLVTNRDAAEKRVELAVRDGSEPVALDVVADEACVLDVEPDVLARQPERALDVVLRETTAAASQPLAAELRDVRHPRALVHEEALGFGRVRLRVVQARHALVGDPDRAEGDVPAIAPVAADQFRPGRRHEARLHTERLARRASPCRRRSRRSGSTSAGSRSTSCGRAASLP